MSFDTIEPKALSDNHKKIFSIYIEHNTFFITPPPSVGLVKTKLK